MSLSPRECPVEPQWLLRKPTKSVDVPIAADDVDDEESFDGIRCPYCRWQPSPGSRWTCHFDRSAPEPPFAACGTSWNTFSTRGRCPGCDHQWQWTACLRCSRWSRHAEWYEKGTV